MAKPYSSRECRRKRLGVEGAFMHDPVDEQGGCTEHLARLQTAAEVALNPVERDLAGAVAIELREIEADLLGVAPEILVLECLLTVEQHVVHLPEPSLGRRGL